MKAGFKTASTGHAAEASKSNDPARSRTARALGAPVLQLQPELGNQAIQWLFRSGALHPKLAVGSADDPLEKEADRISDHVMRAPALSLRRKCACGGPSGADGECEECRNKRMEDSGETPVVRRLAEKSAGPSEAPAIVHRVLGSPGRPLDSATRADMEGRFGADFGDVRIHTDRRAAESAKAVDALAYTVGSNIAFGERQYDPHSDAGRRLLAHELAHVVQQGAAGSPWPDVALPGAWHPTRSLRGSIVRRQFGLWGTRPDLPKMPAPPVDMTARVASLKNPAQMELNLTTAYINRGEDGMLGLIADIEQELDQYSPADRADVLAVIAPIRDEILAYRDRFVAAFDGNLRNTVTNMLAASERALNDEEKRYGLGKERDHYSVNATKDTAALSKAAQHLLDVGTVLVNKEIEFRHNYRKEHYGLDTQQSPGENARISEDSERAMLSNPEFVLRIQEYDKLFQDYSTRFPILAAFKNNSYGLAAIAAMGRSQNAATVVGATLQDKQDDINKTRTNLDNRKLSVWSLPNIVSGTKANMNIRSQSLENRFVDDTVAAIKADEKMREQALSALTVAVGVISAVATGGGSLVLAAGAAGFGLGLQAGNIAVGIQNYRVQSAAANTALDRARAIAQDEPSLLWLAVDIALALPDVVQCAAIFKSAAGPIRRFLTVRRSLERARGAQKAGAALTAEEAAQLNKILAEEVDPALSGLPNNAKGKIRGELDPLGKLPSPVRATLDRVKWTTKELESTLKLTTGGIRALDEQARYGVRVTYSFKGSSYFDPDLNMVFIADNLSKEEAALAYVHEMTHVRYSHAGLTTSLREAVGTISRQQYIEEMCFEEAEALGNEIAHKFEYQAKSGVAYKANTAAEQAYSDAAAAESRRILAENPAADQAHVAMRSRIAGREALYQEFMAGRIQNSINHTSYPTYYGGMYDDAAALTPRPKLPGPAEVGAGAPSRPVGPPTSAAAAAETTSEAGRITFTPETVEALIKNWEAAKVNPDLLGSSQLRSLSPSERSATIDSYIKNLREQRSPPWQQSEMEVQWFVNAGHERIKLPSGDVTNPDFTLGRGWLGETKKWNIMYPTAEEVEAGARGRLPKKLDDLAKQVAARRIAKVDGVTVGDNQLVVIDLRGQLTVHGVAPEVAAENRQLIKTFRQVVADATKLPIDNIATITH